MLCVRCGVARWQPPCVHSKRPRACRQHAHMLFNMCACCRHTRGRFEWTHGGQEGCHRHFCLPKFAHVGSSLAPEVHERNPWILLILILRIGREQNVADSSNHSLCLIRLFSFSNLEENFGGNQLPDGSTSHSPSLLPPPPPPQPQPRPPQQHRTKNL